MTNIIRLIGSAPFPVPTSSVEPPEFALRVSFEGEEGELEELGRSMIKDGQQYVVDVLDLGGGTYRVVSGDRRHRAAMVVGAPEIWVRVIPPMAEAETIGYQLRENVHRKQLDPYEEANAFRRLLQLGKSIGEIAELAGKKSEYVRRMLMFLDAAPAVHEHVVAGDLSPAKAAVIARVSDGEDQANLADEAVRNELNTEQVRTLVDTHLHAPRPGKPRRQAPSGKVVTEAWRIVRWLEKLVEQTNFKLLSGSERARWQEVFGREMPSRLSRITNTLRLSTQDIGSVSSQGNDGNAPYQTRNFGLEWPADHVAQLEQLDMKNKKAVGEFARKIGRTVGAVYSMRKELRRKKRSS